MSIRRSMSKEPDKMSLARVYLTRAAPYLQQMMWSLVYCEVDKSVLFGMDTFGVTKRGLLLYTKAAVEQWDAEEIAGVLEHEIWHMLSRHHERTESGGYDRMLANCAQDIAINTMLLDGGRRLPKTIWHADHWKFKKGLTWEEYYALLLKEPDIQEAYAKAKANGDPFGHCGSGAGNPFPGEPDDGEQDAMGGRSDGELDQARSATAQAIREASKGESAKGIGSGWGGLLRDLDEAMKPPVIPWQTVLRRKLRRGLEVRSGYEDYRRDRPNRRQWALARVVGTDRAPIMPRMVAPIPNVAVGVDTSGSMSQADLMEAVGEVAGVLRVTKAVRYLSCDTQINSAGEAKRWQDLAKDLKGGGGTLIAPFFDHVRSLGRKSPNLLIIATDGGFWDCPAEPPPRCHVIWVLVGKHADASSIKFGEVVRTHPEKVK